MQFIHSVLVGTFEA